MMTMENRTGASSIGYPSSTDAQRPRWHGHRRPPATNYSYVPLPGNPIISDSRNNPQETNEVSYDR